MKYLMAKNNKDDNNITNEMRSWFKKRTNNHIKLVQKYCRMIEDYDPVKFKGLYKISQDHDQSKFEDPEVTPYIYLTWEYKCKDEDKDFDISKQIKDKMSAAILHHFKHNRHHPESHDPNFNNNNLNRENRDAIPDKMVDATKMDYMDIAEMVADFCAMSEERGNSPSDWVKKNIGKRWKFIKRQEELIYKLIDNIWKEEE